MIPSHLLAGPSSASSGSSHRRSSLSPPGGAYMVRRPSSLRESRSACDLMDTEEEGGAVDGGHGAGEERHSRSTSSPGFSSGRYRPETSPTSSESSDDTCDFQDHFPSPPSSSSSSLSLHDEHQHHSRPTRETVSASTKPLSLAQRRPRPLAPLSSLSPSDHSSGRDNNAPSPGLPKAQPLARTLFARMADTPHAGTGLGGRKGGGKQKMIVATKPMRTTFELGLTSSELARRA